MSSAAKGPCRSHGRLPSWRAVAKQILLTQTYAVVTGFVNVNDIALFSPEAMPWINPRLFTETPTKKIPKTITESVLNEPNKFHRRNRGITVIAPNATLKDGNLVVERWPEKSGLLDGGTTVSTLVKNLASVENADAPDAFVRVEFLVGNYSNDEVVEVAESRNTSQQVSAFSIRKSRGRFQLGS